MGFEHAFDCNDFVTILENTCFIFTLLYKEDIVLYIGIRDLEEREKSEDLQHRSKKSKDLQSS